MSWNYRLVKKMEGVLEITEIYYDENGNAAGSGDAPVPYGETVEDVKECLRMMLEACDKPVIDKI